MIEPSLEQPPQADDSTRKSSLSWVTPVVGLLMLVVGLVAGYFVRPVVLPLISKATLTPTASPTAETSEATSSGQPGLNAYVAAQTQHFMGDANAPVTIIEFSDFQ